MDERVPRIGEIRIMVRPEYYLSKARQELANGNKIGAIQHYNSYVENLRTPHDMPLVEQITLTKLVMSLSNNVIEPSPEVENEILKCYLTMLNSFPANAILLNAFGVYFFAQGEYTVARHYLQKAASLGYLPAEKNYLHVIWHLIPRWHFRMLNDRKRNEFFRDAIHRAIDAGFKDVYDIGCGCGILTLIAATYRKDVRVTSIEENKILYDLTDTLVKKRNFNIRLVNGNSNTITTRPAPCNLIVTEIFDAGVFGEDCLKTIHHALEYFVDKKFRIIPASAKLYVTAFESRELTRKFRYTESLKELKLENICLVEVDPEPYDAEYLTKKPVKFLSDTKAFLEVKFYNKAQLNDLLTPDSDCIGEIELVCSEKGTIHALAVWFDLRLDAEITITTNPFIPSNTKCWEQAIVHLDHPIEVAAGDTLRLKPRIVEGQIHFDVLNHENTCEKCFEVSREVISFLNDTKLVQSVIKAADSYEHCDLRIIDFNVFPLFGFLMAKKGATVYHVYNDESDLTLFNHIVNLNELPVQRFIFIYYRAVEDYLVFLEPPHLVFYELVKPDGSWSRPEYSLEMEAKLTCAYLPQKVFLHAQLISSDYLTLCNKVDDKKALNFKIADLINAYSGNEHPNLETLEHKKHSSVVTFDISDLYRYDFHMEADIIKSGSCNGILYWFDIQFTADPSNVFNTLTSTHYDRSCTLLIDKPKVVKAGEKVMIHIMRLEGFLKLYCD
ncbi:Putative protein arginine N-methyltransferase 9-like Protein [Tribolium castaneum]|uniref:Protein arginine N-methyltransferase domain-containing protein n=2 Tax=Tribolium castaneum TaxID=7070 RepID=D2A2H2_TRICA|nr:Putative protein arginine N-methyltransferase 9-like Protein [Tribolium castaneum]